MQEKSIAVIGFSQNDGVKPGVSINDIKEPIAPINHNVLGDAADISAGVFKPCGFKTP